MNIKSTSNSLKPKSRLVTSDKPLSKPSSEQVLVDRYTPSPEKPSFLQALRPNRKKLTTTATVSLASVALAGVSALATEVAGPGIGVFGTTAVVTAASVLRAHHQGSSLRESALLGAQIGFYSSLLGNSAMGLPNPALALGASGAAMGGITYLAYSGLERNARI